MSLAPGRATVRVLAAFTLIVAALTALPGAAATTTTRTLTITGATAHPAVAFKTFDGNPPKTFDIDGDGTQEIIAANDNQYTYVFDSGSGALLAQLTTTFPSGWGARTFDGPEAYTDGGVTHIVLQNSAAYVTSFRFDAAGSTATHFNFVKEWERRLTDCFSGPGSDSKPVLVDLDKDGHYEILASTEESGVYALRASTGAIYWKKCIGGGNADMVAGDLNLDGWPDVVFGSDGGVVTAINGRTGTTMWGYSVLSHFNLQSGSMPVGGAIGQIDGVGGLDYVVGARDSHNATDWSQDHSLLLALSSGGSLLWAKQDPGGNPLTYTHPIIADAAGDGQNEIYWGDWNTIGHKPPYTEADSWKVTGPAHFYRYDKAGNLVWRQTLSTFWSNKDLALADVDGDGAQELLATGPNGSGHEGIWYLNPATGAMESFVDAYPWMVTRGPVIGDLRGTGTMQFVLEVGPMATSAGPAIHVYDTGAAWNALWPHLPTYPLGPAGTSSTTSTTGPPPGPFCASFRVNSPNEWWQEVAVTPDTPRPMADVKLRVNNGPWQSMDLSQWGTWTSSQHALAGSTVEFLAIDPWNEQSQSQPFIWLDGTLTHGCASGTSTTTTTTPTTTTTTTTTSTTTSTGPFTATFTPASGSNEWWVEVAVQANQPVATVEAQVGSGAWTTLVHQSWGSWAKSFHVVAGSQVTFRATSTGGEAVVSPPFTWLSGSSSSSSTGPGAFTATFAPVAVGNDWWIEARVTANHPLATVETRLNGGAWTALTLQSWGNWAKSLHAPDGTVVTFRATDTGGATVTSGPTTWT